MNKKYVINIVKRETIAAIYGEPSSGNPTVQNIFIRFEAPTLEALIGVIKACYGDSCTIYRSEGSNILIDCMETLSGDVPTAVDVNAWRSSTLILNRVEYMANISTEEEVDLEKLSASEAVQLGLED